MTDTLFENCRSSSSDFMEIGIAHARGCRGERVARPGGSGAASSAQAASTASLTVTPKALLMSLMSSSGALPNATRRPVPAAPLHGVRGASGSERSQAVRAHAAREELSR